MQATIRRLLACLCLTALTAAPGLAQDRASAYEQLDSAKLMSSLQQMGMTELLDAYASQFAGQEQSEAMLRYKVSRLMAQAAAAEPEQRDAMLVEAIEHLRQLVDIERGAPRGEDVLQYYRDAAELAVAIGITRAEPYVERLMMLQGGAEDARVARELTGDGLEVLEDSLAQAETSLRRLRGDWNAIVTGTVSGLEEVLAQMRYRAAWMHFHRAVALDPQWAGNPAQRDEFALERRQMLSAAANEKDIVDYAEGDARSGVKYWSLLLRGMAVRELGEPGNAREFLTRAAVADAEPAVQFRAHFELARVHVQRKDWAAALQQVQTARTRGAELFGPAGRPTVDFQTAILESHVYRLQAADVAASNPERTRELELKAQDPLIAFIERHPDFAAQMCRVLAGHEPDTDELERLSSAALLGKAILAEDQARTGADAATRQRAVEMYRLILDRKDDLSRRLQPLALWNLALLRHAQGGGTLDSALLFRRLAAEHPDNVRAFDAARNSVAALASLVESGTPEAALRQEYVRSLELLLNGWGDRQPRVVSEYAAALARQHEFLGQYDQAIEWFQRVPADSADLSRAQHEALRLRMENFAARQEDTAAARQAAQTLVADLTAYAAAGRQRAQGLPPEAHAAELALSADADLRAAAVLKSELNDLDGALRQIDAVRRRWADAPGVLERAQALRVQVHIDAGNIGLAIGELRGMAGGEALAAQVAHAIRRRIDELRDDPQRETELQNWRRNYLEFAQRVVETDRRYACRQMLAEALVENGRAAEGLRQFEELAGEFARGSAEQDAGNVWGLARAHRSLGNGAADAAARKGHFSAAVKAYQHLLDGLGPDRVPLETWQQTHRRLWWRAQLELAGTLEEAFADQPEQLKLLGVRIEQLRAQDSALGGYLREFNAINERVRRKTGV